MFDITITVLGVGAQPINKMFVYKAQADRDDQLVSDFNATLSFRKVNTDPWVIWNVEPTPQPQMKTIETPNNGDTELTITVMINGVSKVFKYQCQFVEFQDVSSFDKTVNFILKTKNWWKWRLNT